MIHSRPTATAAETTATAAADGKQRRTATGSNAQISHGDMGPCPAQKNGRSFDGAARPRTWPARYERVNPGRWPARTSRQRFTAWARRRRWGLTTARYDASSLLPAQSWGPPQLGRRL